MDGAPTDCCRGTDVYVEGLRWERGCRGMAAPQNVEVGTRVLPFDGTALGWMNEAPTEHGPAAAQTRREMLARDGYLLLRGAVPRELVDAGCAAITAEVARQGWLVEGTDPSDLIVKKAPPGSGMLRTEESDVLMNDPAVRRVLHGLELHGIFAELFGEPAISLDYKWFRAVIPEQYSGFHMDNVCECSARAATVTAAASSS